jgi:hypothetical protein
MVLSSLSGIWHISLLSSKTMDLKQMGKGSKPNKAQTITDEEVDTLYTTGQMGMHNPDALRMLWFQNTEASPFFIEFP